MVKGQRVSDVKNQDRKPRRRSKGWGRRSGGDNGFCWGYVVFEALPTRHKIGKQLDAEADSLKREIEVCESSAFCGG